jgi:CelD/BcsL family acetyltransferase involved in cellulose biosynthesis
MTDRPGPLPDLLGRRGTRKMQPSYRFDVITDPGRLGQLRNAWNDLHAGQASAQLSDSFDWAALSWSLVTSHRRRTPYCVVVRRGSRVVAVWPLVLTRRLLLSIASPMNSEGSEYCPCLLDPDEPLAALRDVVRQGLADRGDVDALRLPHVRPHSGAHDLLTGMADLRTTIVQPAPRVHAADFADADDYVRRLPATARATLRRRGRKLQAMGDLEFAEIAAPAERAAVLRWLLEQKGEWLERRDLVNAPMFSHRNVAFLEETLSHAWPAGDRRVFALKVGGRVAAAELVSVDRRQVESFSAAFDSAFQAGSPGHHLTLEVIRWALARGLDYDFRPGAEAYKTMWANRIHFVTSHLLPLTLRGRLFVRYRLMRRWLSSAISPPGAVPRPGPKR